MDDALEGPPGAQVSTVSHLHDVGHVGSYDKLVFHLGKVGTQQTVRDARKGV